MEVRLVITIIENKYARESTKPKVCDLNRLRESITL
jgi:hypothetical protein